MGNNADYEALLPAIAGIEDVAIRTPSAPVRDHLREAERVCAEAAKDRPELEAAGLDWTLVESIPARAGALRQAESNWLHWRIGSPESQNRWEDEEEEGTAMRDDLLAAMRFAYRRDEDTLDRLSFIAEGGSHADLVQDLNDLATLGRMDPAPLAAINYPESALDEAAAKSDELASLLAARDADSSSEPSKKIRDQAFTFLEDAVDEVRAYGRYAMRKDPNRAAAYIHKTGARRARASSTPERPAAGV